MIKKKKLMRFLNKLRYSRRFSEIFLYKKIDLAIILIKHNVMWLYLLSEPNMISADGFRTVLMRALP